LEVFHKLFQVCHSDFGSISGLLLVLPVKLSLPC